MMGVWVFFFSKELLMIKKIKLSKAYIEIIVFVVNVYEKKSPWAM